MLPMADPIEGSQQMGLRATWLSCKYPASRIWAAVLSPTVDSTSEVAGQFTQSQIAATIAKLLGQDYNAAVEKAGAPLPLKWH